MEEFKAVLYSDKKHKNRGNAAPPSGLVRSARHHGCVMRYLRDATFTRAIFTSLDALFTRFDTSLIHIQINNMKKIKVNDQYLKIQAFSRLIY